MKKLICLLIALILVSSVFAEINPARRAFELGIDALVGLSNNYFTLGDIFTEEIVLDFNDMSDKLTNSGLRLDLNLATNLYFNVNIKNKFTTGIFARVEGDGYGAIPKAIIDFIANGNTLDKAKDGTFGLGTNIFAVFGASFGTHFGPEVHPITFKITPNYFMPLIHAPSPSGGFSFVANSDVSMKGQIDTTFSVYTPFSIANGFNFDFPSLLKSGGLDLSIEAEYPLLKVLDLGVLVTNLPLKPAQLKYEMRVHYAGSVELAEGGLIGTFADKFNTSSGSSEGGSEGEGESGSSIATTTTTPSGEIVSFNTTSKSYYRPFKIGFQAAYRPLKSEILILKPILQFKFNDPNSRYTGMFRSKNFDMEFGIRAETWLMNMIGLALDLYRANAVWTQELDFAFNVRVFELDIIFGGQSANIWKSFAGSGVYGGVAIKLGL